MSSEQKSRRAWTTTVSEKAHLSLPQLKTRRESLWPCGSDRPGRDTTVMMVEEVAA